MKKKLGNVKNMEEKETLMFANLTQIDPTEDKQKKLKKKRD